MELIYLFNGITTQRRQTMGMHRSAFASISPGLVLILKRDWLFGARAVYLGSGPRELLWLGFVTGAIMPPLPARFQESVVRTMTAPESSHAFGSQTAQHVCSAYGDLIVVSRGWPMQTPAPLGQYELTARVVFPFCIAASASCVAASKYSRKALVILERSILVPFI